MLESLEPRRKVKLPEKLIGGSTRRRCACWFQVGFFIVNSASLFFKFFPTQLNRVDRLVWRTWMSREPYAAPLGTSSLDSVIEVTVWTPWVSAWFTLHPHCRLTSTPCKSNDVCPEQHLQWLIATLYFLTLPEELVQHCPSDTTEVEVPSVPKVNSLSCTEIEKSPFLFFSKISIWKCEHRHVRWQTQYTR